MVKRKKQQQILGILVANGCWYNDNGDEKNDEAHQALIKVLALCREMKPAKQYKYGQIGHLGYLLQLLKVRNALIDKLYMRACNELANIVHDQPISQPRILNSVIALLSEYLEVGG